MHTSYSPELIHKDKMKRPKALAIQWHADPDDSTLEYNIQLTQSGTGIGSRVVISSLEKESANIRLLGLLNPDTNIIETESHRSMRRTASPKRNLSYEAVRGRISVFACQS